MCRRPDITMTEKALHTRTSGDVCETVGKYESQCRHQERKLIRQGGFAPICWTCRHIVVWHLIKEIR